MAQLLTGPPNGGQGRLLPLRRLLCVALLTPLVYAPAARAQGDDVDSLRQELGDLKRAVERLDAHVQRLEQQPSPAPTVTAPAGQPPVPSPVVTPPQTPIAAPPARETPPPSAEAGVRQRWREVDYGMTTEQITALLGPPQRTMDLNPKTVWYYTYPEIGNGSVVFTADSGVIDWQPPPFNLWW